MPHRARNDWRCSAEAPSTASLETEQEPLDDALEIADAVAVASLNERGWR
jgi:hypothetical protein